MKNRGVVQVPSGPLMTVDGAIGNSFLLTLTQNTTIRAVNLRPGRQYILTFVQDATGGHTVAFPSNITNAAAPNADPGSKTKQLFDCESDGTLSALAPSTAS